MSQRRIRFGKPGWNADLRAVGAKDELKDFDGCLPRAGKIPRFRGIFFFVRVSGSWVCYRECFVMNMRRYRTDREPLSSPKFVDYFSFCCFSPMFSFLVILECHSQEPSGIS